MIQRWFYVTLRAYVKFALSLFYRKWQIVHYNQKEETGSILFSANHQNAFIDPLVILNSQKRIPVFLTQAEVFKHSAIARWFFKLLFMLPIYRQRDGIKTLAYNDKIFETCQDYLLKGRHPIGIFTEGSHSLKRTLRPLKKGIARLAFETLDKNPDLDLKIIPVGLNYNDHLAFQTEVLIIFGDPIPVKPYYKFYLENKAQGFKLLLEDIKVKMGSLIINIPNDVNHSEIADRWQKNRVSSNDLYRDFVYNQALVQRLIVDSNFDQSQQKAAQREQIRAKRKSRRWLFFPLWLYGYVNNYISVWFIQAFLKRFVKDYHFTSSVKFVLGAFCAPFFYGLQALFVGLIFWSIDAALVYIFTLPLISWIYFRWLR